MPGSVLRNGRRAWRCARACRTSGTSISWKHSTVVSAPPLDPPALPRVPRRRRLVGEVLAERDGLSPRQVGDVRPGAGALTGGVHLDRRYAVAPVQRVLPDDDRLYVA